MVLTKAELIASLENEVRILLHLASKVDRHTLDYRPTPKQRSTGELLEYLTLMGPVLVQSAKDGSFDMAAWTSAEEAARARDFDQTVAAIAGQGEFYRRTLGSLSEADFRTEIEMFGNRSTRGSFLVNVVLAGFAAYRTQLFCYLKLCGREELTTMNLWRGLDASPS